MGIGGRIRKAFFRLPGDSRLADPTPILSAGRLALPPEVVMRSLVSVHLAMAIAVGSAAAQDYSGSYTTVNQRGGTVTLVMVQDGSGQATGSLAGAGISYAFPLQLLGDRIVADGRTYLCAN
jgi:hypothetical protein